MNLMLAETQQRLYEKLYRDLGEITTYLEDRDVNEIMLNPDGRLWLDRVSQGLVPVGHLSISQAFAIIHTVAGIHGFVVGHGSPHLEAELPYYHGLRGERFTAQVPPQVSHPSFCIRKRAEVVFSLGFNSKQSVTISSPDNPEQSSHVSGTSSPSLLSHGPSLRSIVPSSSCAPKSNNKKKNRAVFTHSDPSSFLFKTFGDFR